MKRSALFAAAIVLPVIAAAQEMDQTGSITPVDPNGVVTEQQVRDRLASAGYTAIGALDRDSDGIWRTTAMKGDTMMSVAVNGKGEIEDR
jgi:hypothetical protein